MRFRPPNRYQETKDKKRKRIVLGLIVGLALIFGALVLKNHFSDAPENEISRTKPPAVVAAPPPRAKIAEQKKPEVNQGLWDGPVLYHQAGSRPIHLILVEKAPQKLYLYRYDGSYRLIKSYACATGEKKGKKSQEKDEKTPEGIYFNNKEYRDSKITIFGDRAFGLNYPDTFDKLNGNRGSGIFIHGSNKAISPFSTNGCVVLNNSDLADLDQRVQFKDTPVIIGERLPYRFGPSQRDLSESVPFLKQAMVPERYAHLKNDFTDLTLIGFEDRIISMGKVQIKASDGLRGFSKLYLADPGKNLLVLLKRDWNEEKLAPVREKVKPRPAPKEETRVAVLVESWRRAWESKNLDAYIDHYHPGFRSSDKNLAAYKRHKAALNQRYRRISVKVNGLRVRIEGSKAVAYFKQNYRSDAFSSERYKRLEFRKKGNSWKIFRERTFVQKQSDWPS